MFGWFKKEPEKEVPQIKSTHVTHCHGDVEKTGRYYVSNRYTIPKDGGVPEKYTVKAFEVRYVLYKDIYTTWVDEESMREIKGETE